MDSNSENYHNDNNLKDLITQYSKHWIWFLFSVLSFLALAYLYNRYATQKFELTSKIQVLEEKGASPELSVFKDLDFLGGGQNEIEDEIEVLNSRSNFIEVVKALRSNIVLKEVGNVKEREIYRNQPIKVNFLEPDSVVYQSSLTFELQLTGKNEFTYSNDKEEVEKSYTFGKNIKTKSGDIIITPNPENYNQYLGKTVKVIVSPVAKVAGEYKEEVKITNIDEFSKIITLSLKHPIPAKGRDILNKLTEIYNKNAIQDKKEIADRTFSFINDRIADISRNLTDVDETAENFKTSKGLADIQSQASINLNVGAANQQELANYRNQLNIASSMKSLMDDQTSFDETLPSNIGLSDPSIANSTAKYNQLVQERRRLLKSSDEKNPVIVSLNEQLSGIKNGLKASLNNVESNLSLTVNSLSRQQSRINSQLYSAPSNQRELRDITRKQETTESLYLYLLQRREESQVALASTAPKSKVIDAAYLVDDRPISPNKPKIYIAAFIAGLLLPFLIIYGQNLLDNKIHSKSALESYARNVPVLAELPKLEKKSNKFIDDNDRSVLAESLRILRTNLDYLIKSKQGQPYNNVVLVTSSVSGEGKTFVSTNLSMIFSSTKKKVLLIGADIRNPKLYTYFIDNNVDALSKPKRNKNKGLSEYLIEDDTVVDEIIQPMLVYNNTVDVIYSGKILPNPSELLMNQRFKELIDDVEKRYDYVIVDSAPLMLVTDTLLIAPYANHTIYVTRADTTEIKVIDFPISLQKEGKIKGLSFLVNDVKESNLGYGGKYGYGYGLVKKKWWQF